MSTPATASERAIEDIFAQSPAILTDVLESLEDTPRLIERQQTLPTGRADLIYLVGESVLLLELKVVTATDDHIEQISGYIKDYENGASGTEFARDRPLIPVLLAPEIPPTIQDEGQSQEIRTEAYDIGSVLNHFEKSLFAGLASFQVSGLVTSVAGISLLNGYLRYLSQGDEPATVRQAARRYSEIGKGESSNPESRINNFRKTSENLGLVLSNNEGMRLTDRVVRMFLPVIMDRDSSRCSVPRRLGVHAGSAVSAPADRERTGV